MVSALVAIGSNLGDRGKLIDQAIQLLDEESYFKGLLTSQLIETAPIGGSSKAPSYLNGALKFQTTMSATEVHQRLIEIEIALGRERNERWASRIIDLDLIGFGNQIVHNKTLTVPHPRMSFRPFVMAPLCEIAPDWVHPTIGRSVTELWDQLRHGQNQIGVSREILPLVSLEVDNHPSKVSIEVVPIELAIKPKLSILTSVANPQGGPRLVLPDSNLASWRKDVMAAIEAVWPAV